MWRWFMRGSSSSVGQQVEADGRTYTLAPPQQPLPNTAPPVYLAEGAAALRFVEGKYQIVAHEVNTQIAGPRGMKYRGQSREFSEGGFGPVRVAACPVSNL